MKKSLMATLVAASMLSPVAFAAEPVELTTAQMDNVTAGYLDTFTLTQVLVNSAPTQQDMRQAAVALTLGSGISSAGNLAGVTNTVNQGQ